MERSDPPYPFPLAPEREITVTTAQQQTEGDELSPARILFHTLLLVLTAITATLTGAIFSVTVTAQPQSLVGALLAPFFEIFRAAAAGDFGPLMNGALFAFTLLTILAAHELGHYFGCRYYKVRATLPYFIPAPPMISPFGTFGAVIRIKEQIRSRRALFDIGIAGPLAGFAFALPASFIGLMFAQGAQPPEPGTSGPFFHDPPLFILFMKLLGTPDWIFWNPVYWAAWGALLVTALNLFPVGQLDGGHVVYALFGPRVHKWVSRVTCAAVALLAVASVYLHGSPVWFIWTLVLLFLLRVGHPPLVYEEPLGWGRIVVAVLGLITFILCFLPFPITM